MKVSSRWWRLTPVVGLLAIAVVAVAAQASTGPRDGTARGGALGQRTGLLPRDHLTEESAIQVDLDKESVRLPLYKGKAGDQTVWYVLLDASDQGIAHDLGVRSEEHTSELQSQFHLVCRLLLEKKKEPCSGSPCCRIPLRCRHRPTLPLVHPGLRLFRLILRCFCPDSLSAYRRFHLCVDLCTYI